MFCYVLRMSESEAKASAEPKPKSFLHRQVSGCGCLLVSLFLFGLFVSWAFYQNSQTLVRMREKQSQRRTVALSNAIVQFDADYDRLPIPSGPSPQGGDRDTDTSPAHGFTSILLGQETLRGERQNLRNLDYTEGMQIAKRRQGGDYPWANGIIVDASTAAYGVVDNHGKAYRVRLDTNHDMKLANPDPAGASAGKAELGKRVLVWGAGKDGKWDTWDDNPKSWE